MEVILLKEVVNLGDPGTIINVKNGYARNYLLPQKMAVKKTPYSLKILEQQKEAFAKEIAARNAQYEEILKKLQELQGVSIPVETGEEGKLFGTVTAQHIADHLAREHQIEIDKKKISLKDHIKFLGDYTAVINLGQDHKYDLDFKVVSKSA
ncbi:MAG TPA: 50S ribosomal protein L9 [Spirochaetota bacterium]|nr:50S ribosomal protein L9 [Spirochaetota bacterium]